MVSAIDSALSGLAAAGRKVEVSAQNLANQSSTATQIGGVTTNKAYIPQDVVQISLGTGGVRTEIRDVGNPVVKYYEPENPQAKDGGFVDYPNVDQAQEMVKMQIASYDYKANLKSITIADKMAQNLLDMIG